MTDFIGFAVQGLFTGIGAGVANWITIKMIVPKLDKGHEHISKIKRLIK